MVGLLGQMCLYNKLFNRADLVDPRMPVIPANTKQKVKYSRRSKVAGSSMGF